MKKLDCTPEELKKLQAVLGPCSCYPAWFVHLDCRFCGCAADVLNLIRERDHLRARLDKLFVPSGGDKHHMGTAIIPGEVLLEKNAELLKRCEELQKERDHLRKLVDCTQYFQEHVPEDAHG